MLAEFAKGLLEQEALIQRAKSFDELHALVSNSRISGVGDLTCYDVAHRIGAYLRLKPTMVYLHAGADGGAKVLGLARRRGRLLVEGLPLEFQDLSPEEVEDILCIFKSFFVTGELNGRGCGCGPKAIC